jgi:hypothetical protein
MFLSIDDFIADENSDLKCCKWESMLNHIQGIHEHDNDLYPACAHGEIERAWMDPGDKTYMNHIYFLYFEGMGRK